MRAIILVAAVLSAALIVGCGGGEEGGTPSPVGTPTVAVPAGDLAPADLIAQLPGLLLTADDLPSGFVQTQSGEVSNEMVAQGDPLPEQRLQELEETGRVGGYRTVLQSQQGVVSAVLSVYETAEGAEQSLEMGVRFGVGVEATPVDAPDVGLPALAWKIKEQIANGLTGYLMLACKGRINISVTYGDLLGVSEDDMEGLLKAQIAKLGDLE